MIPVIAAAAIAAGANLLGGWIGQSQQRRENRRMRRYNSPKMQMARYQKAGLNPNLAYTQGNPGSWGQPQDYASMYQGLGSSFISDTQTGTQMELTKQKIDESEAKVEVLNAQEDVLKANPYLNESYVNAVVKNLAAVATIKDQEARYKTETIAGYYGDTEYLQPTERGFAMMEQQINQLFLKYNLDKMDQKIKAQIFESKGFENDLKQIQLDWMKNGEITPQHIYQGIMMILQKFM